MKRTHWLLTLVGLLLVGNILWYVVGHWGLITIHADKVPLGEVIRKVEKQGHVTVKTNLDLTKPVTMRVDNVVLAEALETLGIATDSRWRLTYFVAPDKAAIGTALATFSAGQKVEGWKALYVPVPPFAEEKLVPPDPRSDPWKVKPAKEPTLQSYLEQASRNVAASFVFPESWNPAVTAAPSSGAIEKALPRLVSAAKGKYEEIFLLQGSMRGNEEAGGGPPDDEGPRFAPGSGGGSGGNRPFSGGRGGFDREAMEERVNAEINKLPADQKAVALKEQEERKAFFEEMKNLTPEQRTAKMEDFMSQPANQDRMENAISARDARRSPQQRMSRAQQYLQRKAQATAAAKK